MTNSTPAPGTAYCPQAGASVRMDGWMCPYCGEDHCDACADDDQTCSIHRED